MLYRNTKLKERIQRYKTEFSYILLVNRKTDKGGDEILHKTDINEKRML